MILESALLRRLGVRHGFSTRLGGVSTGALATLDLARADRPDWIENRRRFAIDHLGLADPARLHQVEQVHGIDFVEGSASPDTKADGLWTARSGHAVGVRTADCAPVLIAGPTRVAAIHAGWRGATAGIVPKAIAAFGDPPESLTVAIGPTISLAAFEVGPEVIAAATDALGGEAPKTWISDKGSVHLDLLDLLERQLRSAGVRPENVERVGGCTFGEPALYFSYRRDRGTTGRHLSAIVQP
jgi:polyphenol oxidase